MLFPGKESIEGSNPSTAFLAFAWDEMFDVGTPDTFQPRLSNTSSLVSELCDTACKLKTDPRWKRHFEAVRDELKIVSAEEAKVLDRSSYNAWLVSRLGSASPEEVYSLKSTAQQLEAVYCDRARELLLEDSQSLPRTKREALHSLRRWASILLNSGLSVEEVPKKIDGQEIQSSREDFIDSLLRVRGAPKSNYRCILSLVGPLGDINSLARHLGFRLLSKKEAVQERIVLFRQESERLWSAAGRPVVLVEGEVEAANGIEASRLAVQKLRGALDLYNFYSENLGLKIGEAVLSISAAGDFRTSQITGHLPPGRSPYRARHLTIETLNRVQGKNLEGRIMNALEHYNLAQASTATRIKLVNLWTALESLVGTGASAIDSVTHAVAPIVVWRRSDRVMTYLAGALHEWRTKETAEEFPSSLLAKSQAVSKERLLMTLARPNTDPTLKQLFKFASAHPLLIFRLNELWNSFSDPKTLIGELNSSKRRVEWHLLRIYRARNLIVHQGYDYGDLTPRLLDNLHSYFALTLSRILHGMQLNKNRSVDDSIAFWRSRSDYLLHMLSHNPKRLTVADFIAKPSSDGGSVVWP